MSSYQPIGSLVGLNHTIEASRGVYCKLSEPTYRSNALNWSRLTEQEKHNYLAEEHECAHHLLLCSTAAGILEWRIAQVWHRDIEWLLHQFSNLGLSTPRNKNFVEWLEAEDGYKRLHDALIERYAIGTEATRRFTYYKQVVEEIKNAIFIEDVLFSYGNQSLPQITRGQFCDAFNRWNTWASKRSGLSIGIREYPNGESYVEKDHIQPVLTIDPDAPLFSEQGFNISALIEAHATCQELWILEQHGDQSYAHQLLDERLEGPQRNSLQALIDHTQSDEWSFGFSPIIAMIAVTRVLNSRLDISMIKGQSGCYLENILPWLIIEDKEDLRDLHTNELKTCCEDMLRVVENPLFGEHSEWICIPKIEGSLISFLDHYKFEGFSSLFQGLTSLDVNRATYTFKKSLQLTIQAFLAQADERATAETAYWAWNKGTRENLTLLEYTNATLILGKSLAESIEPLKGRIGIFEDLSFVLAGVVFGSSQYHLVRAFWYGTYLPHPEVLLEKIEMALEDDVFSGIIDILIPLYDVRVERIYRNTYLDKTATLYSKQ